MIEATKWLCAKCGTRFRPSPQQRQKANAIARAGKSRNVYCSPECRVAAHPCMVCALPRASEVDRLIEAGEQPSLIIKSLALSGISTWAIAHHRLRHVHGVKSHRGYFKGRCLVCLGDQLHEVERLIRAGLGLEEIASGLSTSYPAVCIGRHRRKCMGIPDVVKEKRAFVPKAERVKRTMPNLSGLTPEEKRLRHNSQVQARSRALRLRIIAEYGGACACCGESREPFLCLDHADGMGAAHRKELTGDWSRGAGSRTYRWLEVNGFPKEGFQILCHNCNCARGMRGTCPHETERVRASMGVA